MRVLETTASALDFAQWLQPGDTIVWGQATAEPLTLTRALVAQRQRLPRTRIFVGIGQSDTLLPEHADGFDFIGYAASGPHRHLAAAGLLDILPCHYSQLPDLIRSRSLPIDVVLVQVSPPDEKGRYSLGLAQEYLPATLEAARVVIAEVNPQVPWVQGDRYLLAHEIDCWVAAEHAPLDAPGNPAGPVELAIARHVAGWVEDGATLQVGIGNMPDAILSALHQHHDLGLHSGAAGDGVAQLAQAGVLTHARKNIDTGLGIAGVLIGTEKLRRWAHHNPALKLCGSDYTHHPDVLARLERFTAINSAIEIDLTGQINAETMGGTYVGAIGGAMDFLRGAARSRGGLPVVALPSTAKTMSRIVSRLSGPVSTPRADAGLIVTEHGCADLRGQPLSVRVKRMIDIAAPEHRAALDEQAHALLPRQGVAFSARLSYPLA